MKTPEMTYRQLGDSSLVVSAIGLGTTHFGAFVDREQSVKIIGQAIDSGINLIDTAPVYGEGHSEKILGDAIRTRRDEVVLATKMGLVIDRREGGSFGTTTQRLTSRNIRTGVERSLKQLKTDRIELLQLYFFDDDTPLDDTFEELGRLRTEGKLLNVGCSNYSPSEATATNEFAIAGGYPSLVSGQCHFNLIERNLGNQLLTTFEELGVGMICNRALARGVLTGKYKSVSNLPENSRATFSQPVRKSVTTGKLRLIEDIESFAGESGHSVTELSIAWLLGHAGVSSVLIGVRDTSQLELCLRSPAWEITDQDFVRIDSIIESNRMLDETNIQPTNYHE